MNTIPTIFSNPLFWELFYKMEVQLTEEQFQVILTGLKDVFHYREDLIRYEYEGKEETSINKVIEFEFYGGVSFSLRLDLFLEHRSGDWANSETTLYLVDKVAEEEHSMGWWDLIRWHPMCIKPSEFMALLEYWKIEDPLWKNTNLPKLLLKNYVGYTDQLACETLTKEVLEEFKNLMPRDFEAVEETLSFMPFYDHYQWKKHQDLGWVYESDTYNCYSIRNECHASGEEGLFPFEAYQRMIEEIKNT